jgi:NhaP-type Na+/H+ or K+/H+ antiporter
MDKFAAWYLIIGALLILLVVLSSKLKRLPLTTAMIYLAVGWVFGLTGWLRFDAVEKQQWIERISELAVIISLFAAGLKLRLPTGRGLWRMPLGLAFISMAATVGLISVAGIYLFHLPWGAAVILGAVLAPTDPVLASDVQVEQPDDTDRVRFTLTGEAGLNDGTAFPFVMLGLGLLGLHDLGPGNWRWLAIDVVWAIIAGLGVGALLSAVVTRVVMHFRQTRREAVALNDFLALGLIAVAYGTALAVHAYGFLAVFAAGLSLRFHERSMTPAGTADQDMKDREDGASESAPAEISTSVLQFNEHLERLAELALVLVTGTMLATTSPSWSVVGFALLLFVVIRPLAAVPLTAIDRWAVVPTALVSWFGIRGIGSIYYLFFALGKGVPEPIATTLLTITVWVVGISICVHGMTVTPLMRWYERNERQPGSKPKARE